MSIYISSSPLIIHLYLIIQFNFKIQLIIVTLILVIDLMTKQTIFCQKAVISLSLASFIDIKSIKFIIRTIGKYIAMEFSPCIKCKILPDDLLMLACSHDLCLNCAAQRLTFQRRKNKPQLNSVVCEICYERTALQQQSIIELQKLEKVNSQKAVPVVQKQQIHKPQIPKKELEKSQFNPLGSLPSELNLSKQTLSIFQRQKIDSIETLSLLTQDDYKQLKIPMGERKRLLKVFGK